MNFTEKDFELFAAFKAGDKNAFYQIYQRMFDILWGYANKLIDDSMAAEEIASQALCNCEQKSGEFKDVKHLELTLYTTTKNLCFNYYNKRKRDRVLDQHGLWQGKSSENMGMNNLVHSDVINTINELIKSFPEEEQIIARLSLYEELKTSEIAALLQMSRQTVLNKKGRIFKWLKAALIKLNIRILLFILIGLQYLYFPLI